MRIARAFALTAVSGTCLLTLTGCSMDRLVWGSDGARVIHTTERLIEDLAHHGGTELICEGADLDIGSAHAWSARSAGEPERFNAGFWDEYARLDPQWSINLEGLPEGISPGDRFPGDVLYRDTDDGLCVIGVSWSTLGGVN